MSGVEHNIPIHIQGAGASICYSFFMKVGECRMSKAMRKAYKILVRKLETKIPLLKPGRTWKNDTKMDL
jgi:hypothetical protein